MKYRTLGKTEMNVSVVGVGTWQYGGEWGKDFSQSEVDSIIGTAKECGINLIDTAECYGDHLSESLVGQAIAGNREDWIVATKFGHTFHGPFDRTNHWSATEVQQQLEDSLRALKTDYIDLYQFHSGGDEILESEDLWKMLAQQVKAGKIRHLGISVGWNRNVKQINMATSVGVEAVQVIYNRLDRGPEEGLFDSCRKQDLGVLARVPLASGFLSGKYKPGTTFPANDVRASRNQEQIQSALKEVEKIQTVEVPSGVDMASWALAWCLKDPVVSAVIPGCKSPEQVRKNAAAADLDMVG